MSEKLMSINPTLFVARISGHSEELRYESILFSLSGRIFDAKERVLAEITGDGWWHRCFMIQTPD